MVRLSIVTLFVASSHAFHTPLLVGRQKTTTTRIRYGNEKDPAAASRGIVELADVSTKETTNSKDAFLGNYEDLVMPGQEEEYESIVADDESVRSYYLKKMISTARSSSLQHARQNIGFFSHSDAAGQVPESQGMARDDVTTAHIDFFSSHAVGLFRDENKVKDESHARKNARNRIDFFSSAMNLLTDISTNDATEARMKARENIGFFSFKKDHGRSGFNKMDVARQVARQNIDFFSHAHGVSSSLKKATDESKQQRDWACSNIGFFSQ